MKREAEPGIGELPVLNREEVKKAVAEAMSDLHCDFAAFATSLWVADGVKAALREHAKRRGRSLRGLVFLQAIPNGTTLVPPNVFREEAAFEARLIIYDPNIPVSLDRRKQVGEMIRGWMGLARNRVEGEPFLLLRQFAPKLGDLRILSAAPFRRFLHVTIDEGILSYGGLELHLASYAFGSRKTAPLRRLLIMFCVAMDKILTGIVYAHSPVEHRSLLHRTRDGFEGQDSVVQGYRDLLPRISRQENPARRPQVILVAQHYLEAADSRALGELLQLVRKIVEEEGGEVWLKLHPRELSENLPERYQSMADRILRTDLSLEALMMREHPAAIVGWTSTCLITAKLLFDIPTVSLARMQRWRRRFWFGQTLDRDFLQVGRGLVDQPESLPALQGTLRRIMAGKN